MKIKMMIGTFGKDEGGCVVPKTPEDPPFEVDSATGNRLIGLGVAIAAESTEEPEEDDDMKENDSLENMSLAELKNLAEQMNLKKTGSRQELIDRILESAENADTVFEDDDMPDMIPADPE